MEKAVSGVFAELVAQLHSGRRLTFEHLKEFLDDPQAVIPRQNGEFEILLALLKPNEEVMEFGLEDDRQALVIKRDKEYFAVLDGVEHGPYAEIKSFLHDDTHFCFAAKRGENWFVVRDGGEFGPYDHINDLKYSNDHVFFEISTVINGEKTAVAVLDGKVLGSTGGRSHVGLVDGHHFFVHPRDDGECYVSLDDQKFGPFAPVSGLGYAEGHFFFIEGNRIHLDRETIDVDGTPHLVGYAEGHLFYILERTCNQKSECYAVLDGKEFGPYEFCARPNLGYSEGHFYFLIVADRTYGEVIGVMVDGKQIARVGNAYDLQYSNGHSLFHMWNSETRIVRVIMDGRLGDTNMDYDTIYLTQAKDNRLFIYGRRGRRIYKTVIPLK
ncbi:hypothetical protein KJ611_00115 [Patescibacteria group bacterium]|nr:hypothetical protein [Patescibacteria group bacterium]MBU1705793.1 hypothetical protein [Patescibacteria group bacterium]